MEIIEIKYHNQNIKKLEILAQGDWIDLRAAETLILTAGDLGVVSLGVSMKLPVGYEAHVVARSSTFKKWGIIQANGMGIIDNSYCGENDIWMFPALALRDTTINEGDRICQFRIVRKMGSLRFEEITFMTDENRGGFGSTGAK